MSDPEPEGYICPECGTTTISARGLAIHRSKIHGVASQSSIDRPGRYNTRTVKDPSSPEPGPKPEKPEPKRGLLDILRGRRPAASGTVRPKRPKAERPPSGKRHELTTGLSIGWGTVGASLVGATGNFPVARIMELQGPAFGQAADRAVAGTLPDKLIQPLMGSADKYRDLAVIASLPLAMMLYLQSPSPATEQLLRFCVRPNLAAMSQALDRVKAQAEEFLTSVANLAEAGIIDASSQDPIGDFIRMLVAPPAPPTPETVKQEVAANG